MQILSYYYNNILRQQFLTKFVYTNCFEIVSLDKIVLRFHISQRSLKNLLPCLAALSLISLQKPALIQTKRISVNLRLKEGKAVNCLVSLKKKEMFSFLEKLLFFILPQIKNLSYKNQKKSISVFLPNLLLIKELEKDYDYFQHLPSLNVLFFFKTKNSKEVDVFLSALKFFKKK